MVCLYTLPVVKALSVGQVKSLAVLDGRDTEVTDIAVRQPQKLLLRCRIRHEFHLDKSVLPAVNQARSTGLCLTPLSLSGGGGKARKRPRSQLDSA